MHAFYIVYVFGYQGALCMHWQKQKNIKYITVSQHSILY